MGDGKTYRLLARRLRFIVRGKGETEVERPFRTGPNDEVIFTDSDESPTLVTIPEECDVNVEMLLTAGAIQALPEPAAKDFPRGKSGEPASG